jgi:hypothetical protein
MNDTLAKLLERKPVDSLESNLGNLYVSSPEEEEKMYIDSVVSVLNTQLRFNRVLVENVVGKYIAEAYIPQNNNLKVSTLDGEDKLTISLNGHCTVAKVSKWKELAKEDIERAVAKCKGIEQVES